MIVRSLAAGAVLALAATAHGQEFVLKFHHPLPTTSTSHQEFIQPWCDKIAAESKQRLKCQIYPSMQLGGTAAQLYDQARDGIVDLVWTLPGYTPGRFPLVEAFELPFMMRDTQAASKAVWDYVRQYAGQEFADVKPLAFHVHGGGLFHMVKKPIRQRSDLRGQKVRAPTRQTTKLLAVLGATPVGMPVPQVPEALSKGVIDGTLLPYEVVPALKVDELTRFHSEPGQSQPTIHTSVFIFAMNRATYDSLPPELKKVIDANSGIELSGRIGRIFGAAEARNRELMPPGSVNVIADAEIERWKKIAQPVTDGWVKDVGAQGADGQALLEAARALIAKHQQ
jgi:TRAP-type C4-dicarboxylate transport system substrate-binding protein